jgi:hypothetical protein
MAVNGATIHHLPPGTTALPELVIVLRRIADALEVPDLGPQVELCSEQQADSVCVLGDRHAGPHVSADGRDRWVDD